MLQAQDGDSGDREDAAELDAAARLDEQYTALRLALIGQKRATVVRLRDERRIDDAVLRQVGGSRGETWSRNDREAGPGPRVDG